MRKYNLLVVTVLVFIGHCQNHPVDFNDNDDKVWPIPQIDGSFRWMTEMEAAIEAILTETEEFGTTNSDKVRFFLYTKSNPTEPTELVIDNLASVLQSNFNYKNPTRVMIHGWRDVYSSDMNRFIREPLLQNGEFNFISVDWSVYSASDNYILSKTRCKKAGKTVGKFIDWMHDQAKLSFESLTIYGHSLGAHVAGFTGKNVQRGRVNAIVGLDPAMPLFRYNKPETRLAETDAEYVESIHTNGGWMGFFRPIGHTAFYPNGGRLQPGCGIDISGICSHIRAVELVSEALKLSEENKLVAIGCNELDDVGNVSCNKYTSKVHLGDPNNTNTTRGIYYLETNSESPFARGL